jgi:hypothetical protein
LTAYNISVLQASQSRWATSASYASSSLSSSYSLTAQNVLGSITSASYALSASYAPGSPSISASYALSASYASISTTATTATTATNLGLTAYNISVLQASQSRWATSASYASSSLSSSFISGSISFDSNIIYQLTASNSLSASYVPSSANRKSYLTFTAVDNAHSNINIDRTGPSNLLNRPLYANAQPESSNWATWVSIVPMDINTTQDLMLESMILVLGSSPDTGSFRFSFSHGTAEIGQINDPLSFTASKTIDINGLPSPAVGYITFTGSIPLTNWNTTLVGKSGRYWEVKAAREASLAPQRSRNTVWLEAFIISYVSNQ